MNLIRSKLFYFVVAFLTLTIGISLTLIQLRRNSSSEIRNDKPQQTPSKAPGIVTVKGGTSFGFCMKDCNDEVTVENTKVQFVLSGNDKSRFPDKKTEGKITEQEWVSILQLIDSQALMSLPNVIGCPDCGDGGAEWVEVTFENGTSKRVTFEYRNQPQQIKALAEKLAAIREPYSKQLRKQKAAEK